jgi:hypothetical protein
MDYEKKYKEALKRAKGMYEDGMMPERLEYIFPELKESEDERIRKEIQSVIKQLDKDTTICGKKYDYNKWIAWLEKQGEQQDWKPSEEQLEALDYAYNSCPDTERGNYYEGVLITLIDELYKLQEKQGKTKPADKVEPKFKVGDWVVENITNGIFVGKITSINTCFYGVDGLDGNWYHIDFFEEEQMHLWTIRDAKDGDVLATDDNSICIFDGTVEEGIYPFAYCGLNRHYGFGVYDRKLPFTHNNDVCPATKEQRNLLFSKMKEAGYEWDAEKKELKKIEQKPQTELPKGEDYAIDGLWQAIQILEHSLGEVDGWQSDDGILEHRCAIEAVKRLYEQKSAWGEEDEKMKNKIIKTLTSMGTLNLERYHQTNLDEVKGWLESLKDKVRTQPRNMWISVDKEVYIKEPVLAQKKDKSDPFKGYVVCCDHILVPNIYERYIMLDNNCPHIAWKPSDERMEALTYLEKQDKNCVCWKENTDDNKPQRNHSVLMITTHGIEEGEWRGSNQWLQYRWSSYVRDSDVIGWMELSNLEKQGEQKPAWSEEDE